MVLCCKPGAARGMQHIRIVLLWSRGFTAAVLSKPAKSITQQHPGLVSAVQMLFTPILRFPPIANRQDQVMGFCCSKLACQCVLKCFALLVVRPLRIACQILVQRPVMYCVNVSFSAKYVSVQQHILYMPNLVKCAVMSQLLVCYPLLYWQAWDNAASIDLLASGVCRYGRHGSQQLQSHRNCICTRQQMH